MKQAVHIGNRVSKRKVKHIISIMKATAKYGLSDTMGIKALNTYLEIAEIKNVTISHCDFSNIGE